MKTKVIFTQNQNTMKKVFKLLTVGFIVVSLMACNSPAESSTGEDATPAEEQVDSTQADAQQTAADPKKRDFESDDLSLTIPEGWTGEVGPFQEITMIIKGENLTYKRIDVDVVKGETVAKFIENEMHEDIVKTDGVKIAGYTFTTLFNPKSKSTKCYAQVGDNILRVIVAFIDPDAPEVVSVVESVKLK